MSEEHGSLIKTPKQLIVVSVIALLAPVLLAFLGAQLVTGGQHIDNAERKESVLERIKPIGELVALEASATVDTAAIGASAAVTLQK